MPYTIDRINPTKTAMIVVDMQNDFLPTVLSCSPSRRSRWPKNWPKR
jgi:nicotinamidase-related amidase